MKNLSITKLHTAIESIKISDKDSIRSLLKKFYKVVSDLGIRQYKNEKDFSTGATANWRAARALFLQRVHAEIDMVAILDSVPKNLREYTCS